MRLTHFLKEGKGISHTLLALIMINLFILGFIAGLSKNSPKPVVFEPKKQAIQASETEKEAEVESSDKTLVASKSGTKVYFVWCTGVSRIKAENKVFFDTLEDALNKGYKPASNCPGM